jgi:hypothetical protein
VLTFNDLLTLAGIDPAGVRLARHRDNRLPPGALHDIWRAQIARFEGYQSLQGKKRFQVGETLASFIVTRAKKTVFVGLYTVAGMDVAPPGTTDPILQIDASGVVLYDLVRDNRLDDYVDKLVIDWGPGSLAWVQRAASQPKPVVEIASQDEPPFPGFTRFRCKIDELPALPSTWREVLMNVKGVYLLVDVDQGTQYVGSAKGQDSLLGRWMSYVDGGHGGDVGIRGAGRRTYQVSVLEVVGATTPDDTIESIESAWKDKLLTRAFGLNRN